MRSGPKGFSIIHGESPPGGAAFGTTAEAARARPVGGVPIGVSSTSRSASSVCRLQYFCKFFSHQTKEMGVMPLVFPAQLEGVAVVGGREGEEEESHKGRHGILFRSDKSKKRPRGATRPGQRAPGGKEGGGRGGGIIGRRE